ncbi:MAG: alpha/beta hydrolase [Hyphomicrobiaceae bacterium]|nr:alpha/beta hydrolase [Hyphomicrobiaceae bacterium]
MVDAVFIPGLLCTEALFAPQTDALRDVLNIAIGEHGQDEALSDIAKRILDHAPDRFVCAGLSMGGYVGFEIMRQAPERVRALILMNTSARHDTPEKTEGRQAMIALAGTEGIDAVADAHLPAFMSERHLEREDLTSTVREMARATGVETYLRQQTAIMSRRDSRELLSEIGVPTLVIVGSEDTLTPPELAQEIAERIPAAELDVIEGCGHLSTIERPQAVNDAIRSFLGKAGVIA